MPPKLEPVDTSVKIPAAVLAAAARANAAMEAQNGPAINGDGLEAQITADAGDDPNAPLVIKSPVGQPTQNAPQNPAPQPTPAPQPEPQQQPTGDDQSWEAKAKSAQGRLQAANNQVRELSARLSNMENLIANMSTAPAAPDPQMSFDKHVTPEDVDTYGQEFFDAVERKARELIEPLEAKLNKRLEEVGGRVEGVTKVIGKSAKEKMMETMDAAVADWRVINENEDFLYWLGETDLLTGNIRQAMLHQAWERNDGPRVAAFFQTFLREQALATPSEPTPTQQQPRAATVSLGAFAAPGKPKPSATRQGNDEEPNWTAKQITEFYADVVAGKFANNPQQKLEIERAIDRAQKRPGGIIR